MSADTGHSYTDLRRMGEQEAREHLTVVEYERWQRVNDLWDGYEETKTEWADEDETVVDLTVHADTSTLGTDVEVFGNDMLVYVDPEDDRVQAAGETLEDEFGDVDLSDTDELDESDVHRLADVLTTMLGAVVVEFNGTAFDDLTPAQRQSVLADCREKWGIQGLVYAWLDIVQAVEADREQKMDVVDSFRSPERRGNRRVARNDGVSDVQ